MERFEVTQLCVQLGETIRTVRRRRGLTSEGLAEAANITPQYLSELERGRKNMSVAVLIHLSRALGVSTDYLIRGGRSGGLGYDEILSILAERLANMTPMCRDLSIQMLSGALDLVDGMGLEKS